MNRMPRRLLWGVLPVLVVGAALAVAGVPGSSAAESDAGRLERLSGALESYVEEGELAGAVALVAHEGEISYLRGGRSPRCRRR